MFVWVPYKQHPIHQKGYVRHSAIVFTKYNGFLWVSTSGNISCFLVPTPSLKFHNWTDINGCMYNVHRYVKDFLYSRQKQDFRKHFKSNGKTSLVGSEGLDLCITMWESIIFCQNFCQIKKSGNIWTVTKWSHMEDIPLSVWFQLIKTKSLIIQLELDWDGN